MLSLARLLFSGQFDSKVEYLGGQHYQEVISEDLISIQVSGINEFLYRAFTRNMWGHQPAIPKAVDQS
jgi:hypothetical protein